MASISASSPNVLFIVADDHQHDAIGIRGHPVVRTPCLDALARRGASFHRAYMMGGLIPALCSPARACLLTGQHVLAADAAPALSSRADATVPIAVGTPLLPELFRAASYETWVTGKWHNDREALQRCFVGGRRIFLGGMCDHERVPLRDLPEGGALDDAPYREAGFSTELFCDAAIDFLERRDAARPFFLHLALTSPHDPRTPPAAFAAAYDSAAMPLPDNFRPNPAADNGELDVRDERLLPKPIDPAALRRELAAYYGMISHHDAQLGRVVDALKRTKTMARTLIVYCSDHGLALGRHGLLGKQNLYEHSVRVPLLLSGPGVAPGAESDALVYALDLYATLARLAGLTPPSGIESRPLLDAAGEPIFPGRDTVFAMYKDCQRMACESRWKLIRYLVGNSERTELFDLLTDPGETRDLSAEPFFAAVVERLRQKLARWQRRIGDRWMPARSPATLG